MFSQVHQQVESLERSKETFHDFTFMIDEDGFIHVNRLPRDRRLSREERLEDSRIRERLKAMPAWKKDLIQSKTKGPMVSKLSIYAQVSVNT